MRRKYLDLFPVFSGSLAILIIGVFHLIVNIIWFSRFESYIDLIYPKTEVTSFQAGEIMYLPRVFEPVSREEENTVQYQISRWCLPAVRCLPGNYAFINTFLFCALIVIVFYIGKQMGGGQVGIFSSLIISLYPCVYNLLSRQVNFYLLNIVIVSGIVLLLMYANYFTHFFFTLSAALLCICLKNFFPRTETTLSYLALTGPLLYFAVGMLKRRKADIGKMFLSFSALKFFFPVLIFFTIVSYDFSTVCLSHIFSSTVALDNQRFGKHEAWYQIKKRERESTLLIRLQSNFFLELSIKNGTQIFPLMQTVKMINIPQLCFLGTKPLKSFPQKITDFYQLTGVFPATNAKRKIDVDPNGEIEFHNQKLCKLTARLRWAMQGKKPVEINVFLNNVEAMDRYAKMRQLGEVENDELSSHPIQIAGFDFLNAPLVALSGYWFILGASLLRPFFLMLFIVLFVFYNKKNFKGKWLLTSWIFIPILTLSFINKKQDWYIITAIPAFALMTGYLLSLTWEKLRKNIFIRAIVISAFFIIPIVDFFYLSFFINRSNKTIHLLKIFPEISILKSFEGLIEPTVLAKVKSKSKKLDAQSDFSKTEEIFSCMRRNNHQKIVQVTIFNDYELFKKLSFYSLFSKNITGLFCFVEDKSKDGYEILYAG